MSVQPRRNPGRRARRSTTPTRSASPSSRSPSPPPPPQPQPATKSRQPIPRLSSRATPSSQPVQSPRDAFAELDEDEIEAVEPQFGNRPSPSSPPRQPRADRPGHHRDTAPSISDRLDECVDLGDIESLISNLKEERSYFSQFLNDFRPSQWNYKSLFLVTNCRVSFNIRGYKFSRSLIDLEVSKQQMPYSWVNINAKGVAIPKLTFQDLKVKPNLNDSAALMLILIASQLNSYNEVQNALEDDPIFKFIHIPNSDLRLTLDKGLNTLSRFIDKEITDPGIARGSRLSIFDQVLAIWMLHLLDTGEAQLVDQNVVFSGGGSNSSVGEKATTSAFVNQAATPAFKHVARMAMVEFPVTAQNDPGIVTSTGPKRVSIKIVTTEKGEKRVILGLPHWVKGVINRTVPLSFDIAPIDPSALADVNSRKLGFWNCYDDEFVDWEKGVARFAEDRSHDDQEHLESMKSRIVTAMNLLNTLCKNIVPPTSAARADAVNVAIQAEFVKIHPLPEHTWSPKGFYSYRCDRYSSTVQLLAGRKIIISGPKNAGRLMNGLPSFAVANVLVYVGNKLFETKPDLNLCLIILAELATGKAEFSTISKDVSECLNCGGDMSSGEEVLEAIISQVCAGCHDLLHDTTPDGGGLGVSLLDRLDSAIKTEKDKTLTKAARESIVTNFAKSRGITKDTVSIEEEYLRTGMVKLAVGGEVVPINASPDGLGWFPNEDQTAWFNHTISSNVIITSLPINMSRGSDPPHSVPLLVSIFALRTIESAVLDSMQHQEESFNQASLSPIRKLLSNLRSTAAKVHTQGLQARDERRRSPISHASFLARRELLDETTSDSIKFKKMEDQPGTAAWYRSKHSYLKAVSIEAIQEEKVRILGEGERRVRGSLTLSDKTLLKRHNLQPAEWDRVFSLARGVPQALDSTNPGRFPQAFCIDDNTIPSILSPEETRIENAKEDGWTVVKNKLLLLRLGLRAINECDRNHGDDPNAEPPRYRLGNTMAVMFYVATKQQWEDGHLGPCRLACVSENEFDLGGFGHLQPFRPMFTGITVQRPRSWEEFDTTKMNMVFRSFRISRQICLALQVMDDDSSNQAKQAAMKMFGDYLDKLLRDRSFTVLTERESESLATLVTRCKTDDKFRWDRIARASGYLTKAGRQVQENWFGHKNTNVLHYAELVK